MPNRKYSPVYLRFLRAKLSNFLKPSFWGTGIFLIVLLFMFRQYSLKTEISNLLETIERDKKAETRPTSETNTNQSSNTSNKLPSEDSLSDEDKAIAAEIDNVSNLLSDFAKETASVNILTPSRNKKQKNKQTLLKNINNQQNTTNSTAFKYSLEVTNNNSNPIRIENPFLDQAQVLLKSNHYYTENQNLAVNSLAPSYHKDVTSIDKQRIYQTYQNPYNNNIVVANPLQEAINKSTHRNQTNYLGSNRKLQKTYTPNNLGVNSGIGYIPHSAP